jgi:hypothetical protein
MRRWEVTEPSDLHGTWHLTRWDYTVDGEFRGYSMGEDAQGQIIYSPDGHMSAILTQADRPTHEAVAFHQASPEERDRAALSYVSYGGTWDLADEVVTHHVAFALFPNWKDTDLLREVSWEDDRLVLTGLPETSASGRVVVNRLFWERAATH